VDFAVEKEKCPQIHSTAGQQGVKIADEGNEISFKRVQSVRSEFSRMEVGISSV
jgi:hypothetical protein